MHGERLRQVRQSKGLTQTQAAEKLGLSRVNYNRYENNEREPDNATLIKLADFFGVTTDYLLGRPDVSTPEITHPDNPPDPTDKLPDDAKRSLDDFKRYVLDKHGINHE